MDDTLNVVINNPKDNSWPKNEFTKFKSFLKILQKLYVQNNIILKSNKIVLPKNFVRKSSAQMI